MDTTRQIAGNDKPWRGKPAVKYYHFIVSPDPRDNVDIDTLRELTLKWATEMFGDDYGNAGHFGSYEVAVTYHDDNTLHIPHAHVIVNNTNLETGRRLQINDRDNRQLLPNRLNEIARDMGLRYFDNESGESSVKEEGRYFTKAERGLLTRKKYSWKQGISNHVAVARRLSRSEDEFLESLDRLGVVADVNINDHIDEDDYIYFSKSNPERWRVSGYHLGRNYTREYILDRLEENACNYNKELSKMRENVLQQIGDVPLDIDKMDEIYRSADEIQQFAFVLAVSNKYNLRYISDYDKRIRMFDVEIRYNADSLGVEIELERTRVVYAKQIALEKGIFDKVNLNRPSIDIYNLPRASSNNNANTPSGRKKQQQQFVPHQHQIRINRGPQPKPRSR